MAATTFEIVLTQAQQLSPNERAQLIGVLAQDLAREEEVLAKQDSIEERHARINAFRGKYRGSLSSVDEFLARKHEETEREETYYQARHNEKAPS